MFWAPSKTSDWSTNSDAFAKDVKGGHTQTCTVVCEPTEVLISLIKSTASVAVLFIFQLPAIRYFLDISKRILTVLGLIEN
jgi:hypothetical protein